MRRWANRSLETASKNDAAILSNLIEESVRISEKKKAQNGGGADSRSPASTVVANSTSVASVTTTNNTSSNNTTSGAVQQPSQVERDSCTSGEKSNTQEIDGEKGTSSVASNTSSNVVNGSNTTNNGSETTHNGSNTTTSSLASSNSRLEALANTNPRLEGLASNLRLEGLSSSLEKKNKPKTYYNKRRQKQTSRSYLIGYYCGRYSGDGYGPYPGSGQDGYGAIHGGGYGSTVSRNYNNSGPGGGAYGASSAGGGGSGDYLHYGSGYLPSQYPNSNSNSGYTKQLESSYGARYGSFYDKDKEKRSSFYGNPNEKSGRNNGGESSFYNSDRMSKHGGNADSNAEKHGSNTEKFSQKTHDSKYGNEKIEKNFDKSFDKSFDEPFDKSFDKTYNHSGTFNEDDINTSIYDTYDSIYDTTNYDTSSKCDTASKSKYETGSTSTYDSVNHENGSMNNGNNENIGNGSKYDGNSSKYDNISGSKYDSSNSSKYDSSNTKRYHSRPYYSRKGEDKWEKLGSEKCEKVSSKFEEGDNLRKSWRKCGRNVHKERNVSVEYRESPEPSDILLVGTDAGVYVFSENSLLSQNPGNAMNGDLANNGHLADTDTIPNSKSAANKAADSSTQKLTLQDSTTSNPAILPTMMSQHNSSGHITRDLNAASSPPSEVATNSSLTFLKHSDCISTVGTRFQGRHLVFSGSRDGSIKVFDITLRVEKASKPQDQASKSQESSDDPEILTLVGHRNWVSCLVISDKYLLSGSYDYTLLRWDIEKLLGYGERFPGNVILNVHSGSTGLWGTLTYVGGGKGLSASNTVANAATNTLANAASNVVANAASNTVANVASHAVANAASNTVRNAVSNTFANAATSTLANAASNTVANVAMGAAANAATNTVANVASNTVANAATNTLANAASNSWNSSNSNSLGDTHGTSHGTNAAGASILAKIHGGHSNATISTLTTCHNTSVSDMSSDNCSTDSICNNYHHLSNAYGASNPNPYAMNGSSNCVVNLNTYGSNSLNRSDSSTMNPYASSGVNSNNGFPSAFSATSNNYSANSGIFGASGATSNWFGSNRVGNEATYSSNTIGYDGSGYDTSNTMGGYNHNRSTVFGSNTNTYGFGDSYIQQSNRYGASSAQNSYNSSLVNDWSMYGTMYYGQSGYYGSYGPVAYYERQRILGSSTKRLLLLDYCESTSFQMTGDSNSSTSTSFNASMNGIQSAENTNIQSGQNTSTNTQSHSESGQWSTQTMQQQNVVDFTEQQTVDVTGLTVDVTDLVGAFESVAVLESIYSLSVTGAYVYSASGVTVKKFCLETLRFEGEFRGHHDYVSGIAVFEASETKLFLATVSDDMTCLCTMISSGTNDSEVYKAIDHESKSNSSAFYSISHKNNSSGSSNPATMRSLLLEGCDNYRSIFSCCFSKCGNYLYVVLAHVIKKWQLFYGEEVECDQLKDCAQLKDQASDIAITRRKSCLDAINSKDRQNGITATQENGNGNRRNSERKASTINIRETKCGSQSFDVSNSWETRERRMGNSMSPNVVTNNSMTKASCLSNNSMSEASGLSMRCVSRFESDGGRMSNCEPCGQYLYALLTDYLVDYLVCFDAETGKLIKKLKIDNINTLASY